MAELIVVGFKKDMYRASEVLNDLTELNDDWWLICMTLLPSTVITAANCESTKATR